MKDLETLSHVRWNCKYHLVFISKYRYRTIYGEVRKKIGGIIRDLCRQKGIELHEGHAMPDHIHLLLSIPTEFGSPYKTVHVNNFKQLALSCCE
jgi:REP-associated tyrosine transposase